MPASFPRRFGVFLLALGLALAGLAGAKRPAAASSSVGLPTLAPPDTVAFDLAAKDALDRQTPRRTLAGFLKEGREGDFRIAASYLDLRDVPESARDDQGPELARKLAYVLMRRPTIDLAKIPDTPEGEADAGAPGAFVVDILYAGEQPVPISLSRVRFPDGIDRWLVSRATVDAVPAIDAAYGPRPIGIRIPAPLTRRMILGNQLWQWIGVALAAVIAYLIARGTAAAIVRAGAYFTRRTPARADDQFVESARRPLRMLLGALTFRLLIDPLQLTADILGLCGHITYTLLVVGVAWLILRSLGVATLWLDEQATRDGTDLLRGRQVRTQAILLRRVASVIIAFVTGAFLLIQFEFVRSVGVSLLASAGVASVVVGLAAQKSLGAIVGGIQFSFAQPVRMGDQIVVEGEFGELEEINLTYAVVRLWDKRRMILPITYFLDKPFQNWTRTESDLLGTIVLKLDFAVPVDAVRAELRRLCEADALWDKKTCSLQVVEIETSNVTLRAVVSAADASKLWDLRCNLREGLLAFVRAHESGPFFPKTRYAAEAPA